MYAASIAIAPVAMLITPGAAVDQDDSERDARDQRAGAEAQRAVEEDVLHPSSVSHRAAGPAAAGPAAAFRCRLYFAPGGFSQPVATFHLPLPT